MDHPIQGLMDTAMKNIRAMVDVDTVIGEPVNVPDGTVIIPVSTVSFGFGAGGSDFVNKDNNDKQLFGGGAGGGAAVKPVAFLVVGNGNVRVLPVSTEMSPVDRVIDLMPDMVDKINGAVKTFTDKMNSKKNKNSDKDEPEQVSADVVE